MEQNIFLSFCSKLVSSTVQASPVRSGLDVTKLIKGDYEGLDFPLIFKQEDGKRYCDILDTGYPSLYLISEKMKAALEENHLTGWKTFPIKLYDKKKNEILGYYGFSVTGRCAPIDYEKSKTIDKQMVPLGPISKYYKGICIDDWDGTDFFSPDKKRHLFITKKAAEIFKKNKITNLQFEDVNDFEINVKAVLSK